MKLNSLRLVHLEIPFRTSFKHTSAERKFTEAVIAVAHSDSVTGYGEGCPRRYVTGEDIASCHTFLDTHRNRIVGIDNLEALQSWIVENASIINENPAAWCAIEMALLDILARETQRPIESLLGTPKLNGEFRYTAVLGVTTPLGFDLQLDRYQHLGCTDYKLKVSGSLDDDRRNIKRLTSLIPECRIRLDANNLWTTADDAIQYVASLDAKIWALEEPLQAYRYSDLKVVAQRLGCQIILDESFLRREQLVHVKEDPELWIPNIRISKMGGVVRALDIAEQCRKLGLRFIVGSQVGETSLLTRAALCVAHGYRDCVLAQEGAFGTYLLEHDITDAPIMFGDRGILSVDQVSEKPGWGLRIQL